MIPPWQCVKSCTQLTVEDLGLWQMDVPCVGSREGEREEEARQLPASELKRKIKNEIREVTVENIMK